MAHDPFDSGSELSSAEEDVPRDRTPGRKRQKREETVGAAQPPAAPQPAAPPADPKPEPPPAQPPAHPSKPDSDKKAPAAPTPKPPAKPHDMTSMLPHRPRPARPAEPSFTNNMSGWDQLFGGIVAPKTDPKSKEAMPEQRAAAKERATDAAAAAARQARAAREAAAREERAEAPTERRAQSMSAEQAVRLRRALRATIEHPRGHFDLLAHTHVMLAFEEDMGAERRQLRATRFGAGLNYVNQLERT